MNVYWKKPSSIAASPTRQEEGTNFTSIWPFWPWILHLFVFLNLLFRIRELHSVTLDSVEDLTQTGDRSGVSSLPQLHPEHHQAGIGIPAAHILDQRQLLLGMLVGVVLRTPGKVSQGVSGAVIALSPGVCLPPRHVVASRRCADSVRKRKFNYCLPSA